MTSTSDIELTCDAFLGGRVMAHQPAKGFRSGVDAVLLAAAVPACPGDAVLELGCGAGVASLCLNARVAGLRLSGVELQPGYAALARQNAADVGAALSVWQADLSTLPPEVRQQQFQQVFANPPYFSAGSRLVSTDTGRETALGEATPLARWVEVAAQRLAPRGYATFIQRADRLGDLIAALHDRLGSIVVQPLAPRVGRDAHLVIVRARKDGRAPLRLCAPLIMHQGESHQSDAEDYQSWVKDILRNGAPLAMRE